MTWVFQACHGPITITRVERGPLDRGVASTDWSALFPEAGIQHITTTRSDHKPLLLTVQQDARARRGNCFRYEIMWERSEEEREEA
jgi:hypothetical protein